MARFRDYIPQGVIPAALLAFDDDFEINESETRRHFQYLSNVEGVTAITLNGHSSEVHACSHDEQSTYKFDKLHQYLESPTRT